MLVAFSVSPMGGESDGSVHDAVAAAVRVVRESGLPNRTSSMFTELEGEWDEVFDVVEALEGFAKERGVGLLDVAIGGLAAQPAVGSVIGIGGMSGAVGGVLLQLATGYVVKFTNSYVPLFIVACVAYPLALVIIHAITPRLAPARVLPPKAETA